MKKLIYLLGTCYTFYSCKAPSYSYVPATMNTTAYSHAGEGQLGLVFGSPGFAGKGIKAKGIKAKWHRGIEISVKPCLDYF